MLPMAVTDELRSHDLARRGTGEGQELIDLMGAEVGDDAVMGLGIPRASELRHHSPSERSQVLAILGRPV